MKKAYEFLTEGDFNNITDMMVEFAQMHVKAALKSASENYKMKIRDNFHELYMNDDWMEVDTESILNTYPLDSIM